MQMRRLVAGLLLVLSVLALVPPEVVAQSSDDPFGGFTDLIFRNARKWAGGLVVLGLLVAGAAVILNMRGAGEAATRVILGALFLIIAGLGIGAFDRVSRWFGGSVGP